MNSNHVPTRYDLAFFIGAGDPAQNLVNLGVRSEFDELSDFWRMDVILGGTGNDVLCGGPGEDWIFGGPGNDVLTGGLDGQPSDLLFGEDGRRHVPGHPRRPAEADRHAGIVDPHA